jgi:uncharacterized protein YjbI with pentapeptide repeats
MTDALRETFSGYPNFTALRDAHEDMTNQRRNHRLDTGLISKFLERTAATGVVIQGDADRRAAQAILNYWAAELVLAQDDGNFRRLATPRLASFDPPHDKADGRSDSFELPADKDREAIRIGAYARVWKDTGREESNLIRGKTLEAAKKYVDIDSDIRDLVNESENRVAKRRLVIFSLVVFAITAGFLIGSYLWFNNRRQLYTDRATVELRANAANPGKAAFYHPLYWVVGRLFCKDYPVDAQKSDSSYRSYDTIQRTFSYLECVQRQLGTTQIQLSETTIKHTLFVNVKGVSLDALRMLRSDLIRFNFDGASFSGATFTDSRFLDSSFVGADLELARFDNGKFISSDFSGANLSHALFDGAKFCHTSIVDANLNGASFWNTKFDDAFPQGFKGTAWWLAIGWNSEQLAKFNELPRPDLRKSGSEAFAGPLKKYGENVKSIEDGPNVDRFSLADALNSYAWWLAINGATNEDDQPSVAGIIDPDVKSFCRKADLDRANFPDNAQAAAEKAVCLTQQLRVEESSKVAEPSSDKQLLSNAHRQFEAVSDDTLGYILLQRDKVDEAKYYLLEALRHAGGVNFQTEFRLAVAEFVIGQKELKGGEKQGALHTEDAFLHMEEAIDGGYVPTHERALLPQIKGSDFEKRLDGELGKLHPNLLETPGYACSW